MLVRREFLSLVASTATFPIVSRFAWAQGYPSRAITMVVPFAPAGGTDAIARIIAEGMRGPLGQPVIIENVSGASGSIGVGRVARAQGDGYTILIGIWSTQVANGAIYDLQYDLLNDLAPICPIARVPWLILGRKTLPADDLKGLVSWLRTNTNTANVGTSGPGSGEHITAILLQKQIDAQFQFIPYRGAGPALQDLMAGHIDILIEGPAASLPQVRAGAVKAFAVMSSSRLMAAIDIPTVDEAGIPGLYFVNWQGLWAPKSAPKEVIEKLNAATVEALADTTVRSRLLDFGQEIYPREQQTPEALGALQKAEVDKWWPIIKAANIKAE